MKIGEQITIYRYHPRKNKYYPISRGTVTAINSRFLSVQTQNYLTHFNIINFRVGQLAYRAADGQLKTFKRLENKKEPIDRKTPQKPVKPYHRKDWILINCGYVRETRKEQKKSLKEFSRLLQIGIHTLVRIESGDNRICEKTLNHILSAPFIEREQLISVERAI